MLKRQGVLYPPIGAEYGQGHHNIAWLAAERPVRGTTPDALRQGVAHLIATEESNILLSSEEFSRLAPDGIGRLVDLFPGVPLDIVYIRRSGPQFVASLWNNMVQHGSTVSLGRLTRQMLAHRYRYDPLDHEASLAKWRGAVGSTLRVIEYEVARHAGGGLIDALLAPLDVRVAGSDRSSNASAPLSVIELIRAANLYARSIGRQARLGPRHATYRALRGRTGGALRDWTERTVAEIASAVPSDVIASWDAGPGVAGDLRFVAGSALLDALAAASPAGWRELTADVERADPIAGAAEPGSPVRRVLRRLRT